MEISREERIQQHMEYSNMTRIDAEFSVALELGEVTGDAIMIDVDKEDAADDNSN